MVAGVVLAVACLLAGNTHGYAVSHQTPHLCSQINKPLNPSVAGKVTLGLQVNSSSQYGGGSKYPFFQFGARNGADIVRFMPQIKVPASASTIALLGSALSGFVLFGRKLH